MHTVKSRDGTRIAYETFGTGPALIYITGASCFRSFFPIRGDAKVFAREFTVYNYDRRGRGDSDDAAHYEPAREVEDVEALIDAAGGEAMIFGHSSGAILALEAAMRIPDKIGKVFIYDAPYCATEEERAEFAQLGATVREQLDAGNNRQALIAFTRGIGMPKVFSYLLPVMPGWKTMRALAPTLMYDIELAAGLPPLERVADIQVPTFIAAGARSSQSMRDVARQLHQSIPDSQHREFEGQDHMVGAKVLLPAFVDFFGLRKADRITAQ